MQQLQEQQHAHMNQIVDAFTAGALPASHGTRNLDERRFRELGSFGGNKEEWKGFALKFRATAKENNPKLHLLIKWAEMEPDELTRNRIARRGRHDRDHDGVQQADPSLEGAAGDDSPDCDGRQRPGGVAKTHEQVQHHDADAWAPNHVEGHDAAQDRDTAGCPRHGEQWEGLVHMLERDYKENMSDMMKIGILIHMMRPRSPRTASSNTPTRSKSTSWSKRRR